MKVYMDSFIEFEDKRLIRHESDQKPDTVQDDAKSKVASSQKETSVSQSSLICPLANVDE